MLTGGLVVLRRLKNKSWLLLRNGIDPGWLRTRAHPSPPHPFNEVKERKMGETTPHPGLRIKSSLGVWRQTHVPPESPIFLFFFPRGKGHAPPSKGWAGLSTRCWVPGSGPFDNFLGPVSPGGYAHRTSRVQVAVLGLPMRGGERALVQGRALRRVSRAPGSSLNLIYQSVFPGDNRRQWGRRVI